MKNFGVTRSSAILLLLALWCVAYAQAGEEWPGAFSSFWSYAEEIVNLRLPDPAIGFDPPNRPALMFEENLGQFDSEARFLCRGRGYDAFFTDSEVVMVLRGRSPGASRTSVLRMGFPGSRLRASVDGVEPMRARMNYFIGDDPGRWRTNVPNYGRITYAEFYPGIDVVFHGSAAGELEFDFLVSPGADPGAIGFWFEGASSVEVETSGDLVVTVDNHQIRWKKPNIFQTNGSGRRSMAGGYRLSQGSDLGVVRIGLERGAFDPMLPLVIDPELVYSTYLGGGAAGTVLTSSLTSRPMRRETRMSLASRFHEIFPPEMQLNHPTAVTRMPLSASLVRTVLCSFQLTSEEPNPKTITEQNVPSPSIRQEIFMSPDRPAPPIFRCEARFNRSLAAGWMSFWPSYHPKVML